MRYCDHCQVGYRKSVYCPIPVGDSPSSKRQYDVLDFGCIPVVLSDDLVYAFTPDAGASYRRRSASTSASASAVAVDVAVQELVGRRQGFPSTATTGTAVHSGGGRRLGQAVVVSVRVGRHDKEQRLAVIVNRVYTHYTCLCGIDISEGYMAHSQHAFVKLGPLQLVALRVYCQVHVYVCALYERGAEGI